MRISDWSSDVCSSDLLVPLIEKGLIDADDIVIDAKSGVSGAGRAAKEGSLYAEVAEGTHAYGVASHRHGPEIEQELSASAGRPLVVTFTPHLMPMNRGMLASIYVRLQNGASADGLRAVFLRLEGRWVGKGCVSTCRSRGGQGPEKKKTTK